MLVQTQELHTQGLGLGPMQLLSLFPLSPFSRQLSLDLGAFTATQDA